MDIKTKCIIAAAAVFVVGYWVVVLAMALSIQDEAVVPPVEQSSLAKESEPNEKTERKATKKAIPVPKKKADPKQHPKEKEPYNDPFVDSFFHAQQDLGSKKPAVKEQVIEVVIDGKKYSNVNISIMPTTMGEKNAISVVIIDENTGKSLMDFVINRAALTMGERIDWKRWKSESGRTVNVTVYSQKKGDFPFFDLVNHEQVKEIRMDGEASISNLSLLTLKLDGVAAAVKREYGNVTSKRVCPFKVDISMTLSPEQADVIWQMKRDLE